MENPTVMIYILSGVVIVLSVVCVTILTIYFKSVKYMSDRILANSLGEAKILDLAKPEDVLEVKFPKDDELLAKEEENLRKKRLMELTKESERLDKEMKKTIKMYG
jgi:cell division protein FtsN